MAEQLIPKTLDLENQILAFSSPSSRRNGTLVHFVSLHPGVQIGTGDIMLGGNV